MGILGAVRMGVVLTGCRNPEQGTALAGEHGTEGQQGAYGCDGLETAVSHLSMVAERDAEAAGEVIKDNLSGLQCRIFQHEYDHMEGSDFTKKVGKLNYKFKSYKLEKKLFLFNNLKNIT